MGFPDPTLTQIYDMHADLDTPQVIGQTPAGNRQVFIVTGGTVEGPRIRGKLLPGGGDWALMRTDGAVQLDVRATIETDDGALIYATYSGLIIASLENVGRLTAGEDVPLSESTSSRIRCSRQRTRSTPGSTRLWPSDAAKSSPAVSNTASGPFPSSSSAPPARFPLSE